MYIICYYSRELESNTWERISGEDAMQIKVSELCKNGLSTEDILVFYEADEMNAKSPSDVQKCQDDDFKRIYDVIDTSMAIAGYRVVDGGSDWVIIRNPHKDRDFEIKIQEMG